MVKRIFRCCPLESTAGLGVCAGGLSVVIMVSCSVAVITLLETVYVFVFL